LLALARGSDDVGSDDFVDLVDLVDLVALVDLVDLVVETVVVAEYAGSAPAQNANIIAPLNHAPRMVLRRTFPDRSWNALEIRCSETHAPSARRNRRRYNIGNFNASPVDVKFSGIGHPAH
jgi:hypothetical protein